MKGQRARERAPQRPGPRAACPEASCPAQIRARRAPQTHASPSSLQGAWGWLLWPALAGSFLAHGGLAAAERFPRPQFDGAYRMPVEALPAPASPWWDAAAVALLVLAIALSALGSLVWRSRRALWLLSLLSFIVFGLIFRGCPCPVGALSHVARAVGDPSLALPGILIALFLLPLLLSLFVGRAFCAAVCPLGAVQELALAWPIGVPQPVDRALRLLPFCLLVLTIFTAVAGAGLPTCRHDPFVAIFRLAGLDHTLVFALLAILLCTVLARPYCRYLCAYGALLQLCSSLSRWRPTITPDICVNCRLCEHACPYGALLPPERRSAAWRPAALLLALALGVPAGGLAGYLAGAGLAQDHPKVQLAHLLVRQPNSPIAISLRDLGISPQEALAQAEQALAAMRWGGMACGICCAAVLLSPLSGPASRPCAWAMNRIPPVASPAGGASPRARGNGSAASGWRGSAGHEPRKRRA